MAAVTGELMARFGVPPEELAEVLPRMSVETYVTVVVEPAAMRPHRVVIEKVVAADVGDDAGDASAQQRDVATYRYRWAN